MGEGSQAHSLLRLTTASQHEFHNNQKARALGVTDRVNGDIITHSDDLCELAI